MPKRISPPSMRVFSAPKKAVWASMCRRRRHRLCCRQRRPRWVNVGFRALPSCLTHFEMAYHSVNGLIDYQDEAYAEQWLARLLALIDRDEDRSDYSLSHEAGRHLALWMAYEDIPRVANKVRPDRRDQFVPKLKQTSPSR